jgi:hypothetical protein
MIRRTAVMVFALSTWTGCAGKVIYEKGGEPADGSTEAPAESAPSANPLDGTWAYSLSSGDFSVTAEVTFGGDGSLVESVTLSQCSGTESVSGLSWTSNATSITVSGKEVCSGSLDCAGTPTPCTSMIGTVIDTTCNYTLSNGNDTLALSRCSGSSSATPVILTRK